MAVPQSQSSKTSTAIRPFLLIGIALFVSISFSTVTIWFFSFSRVTPPKGTTAPKASQSRQPLSQKTLTSLTQQARFSGCDVEVNADAPTQVTSYSNEEAGVHIDIPYSSNWGTTNYFVEPYDIEYENGLAKGISFGPLIIEDGCTLQRAFRLFARAGRTAQTIVTELKNVQTAFAEEPHVIRSGSLDIVEFELESPPTHNPLGCNEYGAEIVGQRANLVLIMPCGATFGALDATTMAKQVIRSISPIAE